MKTNLFWNSLGLLLVWLLMGGWWLMRPEDKPPFTLPKSALNEPWPVQSGLRIATLNQNIATVDRVVLVPDAETFLAAIEKWNLNYRWPILIEDKKYTPMFLERFKPAEVIRMPSVASKNNSNLRQRMQQAIATAWGVKDPESLQKQWQKLGWQPPGVVITSEKDPAWPAAVALAADRGQPLTFLEADFGKVNDTLNPQKWQSLKTSVQEIVKTTGYPYLVLGDAIDTITLVRQLPVKYQSPKDPKEQLAVTDGLARLSDDTRWAAVGWIYGSPARSVYQAMCSIFLTPKTAFLYDSYTKEGNWKKYEMPEAASTLRWMGFQVEMAEKPDTNIDKWRRLTIFDWQYDLVFVNSSGSPDNFNVGGSEFAKVEDIPRLHFPAAIHFIHSWSATTPDNPDTVAGRWLENGAYLYVGSVNEPYLRAFVTPSLITKRLQSSTPFLIATRHLEMFSWKITTIGDPLAIMTNPRRKIPPVEKPI